MLKEIYDYYFNKSATILNRKQLGSIEPYIELTEEEQKELDQNITGLYNLSSKIISKLAREQEEYISHNCEGEKDLIFGRGTLNGIELFQEFLDIHRILPEDKQ